ncbi:Germin [Corchorus olitorius]|uniref:Germin n=1 Tax=Corchorus olitorius TaxID=93759 RepID=A0A1R3HDB3_9ROSI|nr:Germin [Corchorus olitorius]
MLKLTKTQRFHLSNHERLRLLSTSTLATVADTQESSIKLQPQIEEPLESHSSLHVDPKFFISALFSCRNIFQINQVHAQVVTNGLLNDLFVTNKLLYIYVQHKALDEAYAFFNGMRERDLGSWSVMIGGFAKAGDFVNCFGTFRELIRCGLQPDNYTLPSVLRVCRDEMDFFMGSLVHSVVLKSGLVMDHFVCSALVDMYAKCRVIEDARKLFDNMPHKDLVTWTVMIGGYAECGNAKESLALFEWMIEEGLVPDKINMVTVVDACAKLGAMHKARHVHEYICRMGFNLNAILGTAIIDMYAKCGSVDCAREIFDGMREKNVVSWSAMIAAYGHHGEGRKALDLFPMMLSSGIMPNKVTFVSLLYACTHAGLVDEGLRLFNMMWDEYAVRPNVKHYTCMVDLLGRAGRLDEALNMIENMTVEKDEGVWGALLGACRIHKHVELAERAAKSLIELQPQNPGHYVLLSNIYANSGRWEEMAKIRSMMTKRSLKKIPGWTWIEVDNKIHQFSVGDKSHPLSQEIYGMLKSMSEKLELAGYVPDTNYVLHDVDEEVKLGILYAHSEKLAIAFGLIATPEGAPIRITKNLRICGDCHTFIKFVSAITKRLIVVRDANRFHHFKDGACSCGDYCLGLLGDKFKNITCKTKMHHYFLQVAGRLLTVIYANEIDLKGDSVLHPNFTIGDANFFTHTAFRVLIGADEPKAFEVMKVSEAEFPALNGQGVSYAVLQFPSGSLNPLHRHPDSAELLFLLIGSLEVGFVDAKNILRIKTLQPGDLFMFPKGVVHYQFNNGEESAFAVSAFGSSNAGTITIPRSVFLTSIRDDIIAKSFKMD